MPTKITKLTVWSTEVGDRAGGAAEKLEALARAGATLRFALGRRRPERPGSGILFVSPVSGKKAEAAAREAGFVPSSEITGVVVQGPDKPGLGSRMTDRLARAGLNLRGLSAMVIGKQASTFFAFDSTADADRAVQELRKVK